MQYTATLAVMAGAACCNKLAEVQYLHERGCPWPMNLLEETASHGQCELVRWYHEQGCPWQDISKAPDYAAESGNVELMAWVMQLPGTQLSEAVMKAAASKGHSDMCKYLHEQQCPWDSSVTAEAASEGHVDLLRWLIDSGCPWEPMLCCGAAQCGRVELLMYFHHDVLQFSVPWLTSLVNCAGHYNQLATAKWLREQGAEWSDALRWPWRRPWRGEFLKWARAQGCTTPNR
jgi:hypothetical protein